MTTNPKEAVGASKPGVDHTPLGVLFEIDRALACGAKKYGRFNWRFTGIKANTYVNAIMRHLAAWAAGEEHDEESGESHLAHIGASVFLLLDAKARGVLEDDRLPQPDSDVKTEEMLEKYRKALHVPAGVFICDHRITERGDYTVKCKDCGESRPLYGEWAEPRVMGRVMPQGPLPVHDITVEEVNGQHFVKCSRCGESRRSSRLMPPHCVPNTPVGSTGDDGS